MRVGDGGCAEAAVSGGVEEGNTIYGQEVSVRGQLVEMVKMSVKLKPRARQRLSCIITRKELTRPSQGICFVKLQKGRAECLKNLNMHSRQVNGFSCKQA